MAINFKCTRILMLLVFIGLSPQLQAQESPSSKANDSSTDEPKTLWEKIKKGGKKVLKSGSEKAEAVNSELNNTQAFRSRSQHQVMGNYSLIDTWVPNKWGLSYAYHLSSEGSFEIEYLRGTIAIPFVIDDLGKITDQRLSLFYRSYKKRNSLSFLYGINYSSFKAQLGIDYLSTITGGNSSSFDLVSVETLGITWGVGNRWQYKNRMILSIDWFTIYLPITSLGSDADFLSTNASETRKKEIRDALDIIEKLPTFAVFKLQLGISF